MANKYSISTIVSYGYEEAVAEAREALANEGFGILTEIDVKAALKQKLDKDFTKYIILGACNPALAFEALTTEIEVGLLLPCNVIVYEAKDGAIVVAAIEPMTAMSFVGNPELASIAGKVKEKLERVIASLP
ncbi:MAG: DUF302 domain-containing protein [Thermodesulfobacteriota bacterium]